MNCEIYIFTCQSTYLPQNVLKHLYPLILNISTYVKFIKKWVEWYLVRHSRQSESISAEPNLMEGNRFFLCGCQSEIESEMLLLLIYVLLRVGRDSLGNRRWD